MVGLRTAAARELGDIAAPIGENASLTDDDRARMVAVGQKARATLGGKDGADT